MQYCILQRYQISVSIRVFEVKSVSSLSNMLETCVVERLLQYLEQRKYIPEAKQRQSRLVDWVKFHRTKWSPTPTALDFYLDRKKNSEN